MKAKKERCSKNMIKNISLFAMLISALAIALTPNASAKVFTIQNESVDQFVVNGSSGNILLNPNAGFGNVGILTDVRRLPHTNSATIGTASPASLLQVAGTANITSGSTQFRVDSNGDVSINLKG